MGKLGSCQYVSVCFIIFECINDILGCSYEGDNYVLVQQVVRAALKTLQSITTSSDPAKVAASLPPSTSFLRLLVNPSKPSSADWSIPHAIEILELRAAHMVQGHASSVNAGTQDGSANWRVARAVTEAFVARRIGEAVEQAEKELSKRTSAYIAALMRLVCSLFIFPHIRLISLLVVSPFHSRRWPCGYPIFRSPS